MAVGPSVVLTTEESRGVLEVTVAVTLTLTMAVAMSGGVEKAIKVTVTVAVTVAITTTITLTRTIGLTVRREQGKSFVLLGQEQVKSQGSLACSCDCDGDFDYHGHCDHDCALVIRSIVSSRSHRGVVFLSVLGTMTMTVTINVNVRITVRPRGNFVLPSVHSYTSTTLSPFPFGVSP